MVSMQLTKHVCKMNLATLVLGVLACALTYKNNNIKMPITQLVAAKDEDDSCRTFIFEGEGHTLGNALRCVICGYPQVEFCAYTVPHPMEATMHFRIQTRKGKAVDFLKKGLEDLVAMSDHVLEEFKREKQSFDNRDTDMSS